MPDTPNHEAGHLTPIKGFKILCKILISLTGPVFL
jgi:hypothetical protein